MKRTLSAFLLLAGLVACSSAPEHGKVGAVAGQEHWSLPTGMTNPATADAGLLAAVGDIYTAADLSHSFVRFGTGNQDWQPFPSVAATTTTAGLMTASQFVSLNHWIVLETPLVDLTATGTTAFAMPALPSGLYAMSSIFKGFLCVGTGTQTQAPTIAIGQNSTSFNNVLTATSTTVAAAISAGVPASFLSGNSAVATELDLLANPMFVNITVPAVGTGGFSAKAKFSVWVWVSTLN